MPSSAARPLVGLLYNPATPALIDCAAELIEYVAVMPDRLWFDFGPEQPDRRFHRVTGAIEQARCIAKDRITSGHGIGLSLPSAIPLDEQFLAAAAEISVAFGGFKWYSEHLSLFIAPKGSVPNAQAGLGLPLAYDTESYAIISAKLARMREVLNCPLLLENGAFFTPIPDSDMSEPEFLNQLHRDAFCGTLLDLHNLYVSWRNGGISPNQYLAELNPNAVEEIHLAGGDDYAGFYMDSHSDVTPPEVWEIAFNHVPRFRRLRAITFEFQETYLSKIGIDVLVEELRRMHELAKACVSSSCDVD